MINNVPGHPLVTFAPKATNYGKSLLWWSGKNCNMAGICMGDYDEMYWTTNSSGYEGDKLNMSDLIPSIGQFARLTQAAMNLASPLIIESAATVNDYVFQGPPMGVTSCTGTTITTSTPHSVYNVLPDLTRATVSGSSACDGNYYIIAAPTATTLTVVLANATVSGAVTGGTIHFAGGANWPLSAWAYGSSNNEGTFDGSGDSTCPNTWKNNRGQTFTISGSSNSGVNAATFWFTSDTLNVCPAGGLGGQSYWRQFPNLSSTGGTIQIITDNWYVRGRDWQTNSEVGPRYMFGSVMGILIWGGAGHRAYTGVIDPDLDDLTLTGVNSSYGSSAARYHFLSADFNGGGFVQGGISGTADVVKSHIGWLAHGWANLVAERLEKYAFGQKLPSPDYGPFYEAAARQSSSGNVLMIQSFLDGTANCTANLSPYLIAGQPIIRISATGQSGIEPIVVLPAGTASDTMTCLPGEFRAYIFSKNEAAELTPLTISARLGDVPNSARIVVQFSYGSLPFTSRSTTSQTLFQTFDCGSGTCTLPVDRQIAPVIFRVLYLDVNSKVLATSDLLTL
jgi:hypothetical protein